jgi:hypothetical protein
MNRIPSLALAISLAVLAGACDETQADCPTPTPEGPAAGVALVSPAVASVSPAAAVPPAAKPAPITPKQRPAAYASDTSDDEDCAGSSTCDVDADTFVKRLVIARGVENREPIGAAPNFAKSEGKRIYAFVEVGNRSPSASEVSVSFRHKGGQEHGRVPLRVGASPRWRTWAYTDLATEVGAWEAVVRNARGDIIGRQSFTVTENPGDYDPYEEPAPKPAESAVPGGAKAGVSNAG